MSRAYSPTPILQLSDAELREILLTIDGRGREVKTEALEELIARARRDGEATEYAGHSQ